MKESEIWYTDQHTKVVRFSVKSKRQLAGMESDYQQIDILDTYEYGRVLILDGDLYITEKDEFIYHEMVTHVAMAVHPGVRSVLVIGGCNGGTVRELTKYPGIENIDMVEADRELVEACMQYMPFTSSKLRRDKRVHIFYEDGLRFVRGKKSEYDLIIVDCADPYSPAEGLFTREFYGNCFKALNGDGIFINQHESPFYSEHRMTVQKAHKQIATVFPLSMVYQCHIPSYPSGHWLFGFASKKYHPINDLQENGWNALGLKTRYYNTDLHKGCFMLPTYVKELLN